MPDRGAGRGRGRGQTRAERKAEWRAQKAAMTDKDYLKFREYNQLLNLIHDENTSAADCTKPFIDQVIKLAASPHSERQEDIDNFVSDFASAIVDVGGSIPYGNSNIHARLVDFVLELQKVAVTDPNSTTGEPITYGELSRDVVWTKLPLFGMFCTEAMNDFDADDPYNTPGELERWKNLTAFWAGLSRRSNHVETDFVRHGLYACLDAFGPLDSPKEVRPSLFFQQVACIWFIYAADALWACCQEGKDIGNRESWVYWTKAMEGLKDADGDVETQNLINKALTAIKRAEQGV